MAITTVLFDLDGTLLPMDQDVFIKFYFSQLAKRLAPYGYESEKLIKSIWAGTANMIKNDGSKTNETVFWDTMASIYGEQIRDVQPLFDAYYEAEFLQVQQVCGFTPLAAQTVRYCKQKGLRVALATNPFFPAAATRHRTAWAGLSVEEFAFCTTYEQSCYCKPNPAYYRYVLQQLQVQPEECLMVGNDVQEDMMARELGMQVFLLTDCLINRKDTPVSDYPNGSFPELMAYIDTLI